VIFVLLAAGIAVTGDLYYESQKKDVKKERNDDLNDIANLKVNEISWWLRERSADANGIFRNTLLITDVHRWMTGRSDAELRGPILDWMSSLKTEYDYKNVFLFDATGSVMLSLPSEDRSVGSYAHTLISEALQTRKVVLSDLYYAEDKKSVHMDLVIPLLIKQGHNTLSVGGLLLCIDPRHFLYPLIKTWPTPSRTAETLLVRREGNDVVFLNELRFRMDSALTFRLPITDEKLPAAMAVLGKEGIVEGVDYRGVPVIAAIRSVPNSSWALVAKIDVDEIYAPVRERYWLVVLLIGVLIAGAGGGVGFVWRNQSALHYMKQYEAESVYRTIFANTGTATNIAGEDTIISLVNAEFEKLSGYSKEELEGKKSWTEFIVPDDLERLKGFFFSDMANSYPGPRSFEFRFVDRNGTVKDILASVEVIPGMKKGVASFLDITERKQAEEALRRAHDELETLVDERTSELKKSNETLTREIIEHMRTEEALRDSQKELRYLSGKIVSAQETERRRIARELHDQLGQDLTLMKLQLRAVQRKARIDEEEIREGCEEILRFIDQVVENVRRLSRNLSPVALEELGLSSAIRGLVNAAEKTYDIRIATDAVPLDGLFAKDVQIGVYRVLQEALTNVGKHARAKNVSLAIRKGDGRMSFSVEDDGTGFNVAQAVASVQSEKGLGLTIMKERVQMLGGTFDLWSEEGKGTRVTFSVPLEEEGDQ